MPLSLRPAMSFPGSASLLAGTALGLVLVSPVSAAQGGGVDEVVITGRSLYTSGAVPLTQFTQPLIETPQSVSVVSAQELEDRAISDLNDALRNVPGISLGAGEFSWQGNTPVIRGFSSRSDIFLDGMRDFGNYYRDSFNLEQLEVLQGPSSIFFGRGSTGGVINQTTKSPFPGENIWITASAGTDGTMRAVADVNMPVAVLGDGAAARLVGMVHQSQSAGRDYSDMRRHGIAPSLALSIGTPTRIGLSYFYQEEDNRPDYGLPWYFGRPAPVSRDTFYGYESDFLETSASIATARISHDLADELTISTRLRYASYSRDFRISEPVLADGTTLGQPLDTVMVKFNIWSGPGEETALLSQTDITAGFTTGGFTHSLVAGVELGRETSYQAFGNSLGVPNVSLLNLDPAREFVSSNTYTRLTADTSGDSFALFAVDTVELSPQWELTAGLRWDYFKVDYRAARYTPAGDLSSTERIVQTDRMPSYRAALVYKAAENGTVYVVAGTSFNPSTEGLSQLTTGRNLGTESANLDPEENVTFELGTKWEMLAEDLTVSVSVFRLEKSNARIPDLSNPGFNILGGEHRVDGIQLQATGLITPQLMINAGYTFLESQVTKAAEGAPALGRPLINTPKHSLSAFVEYSFPSGLDIGAGALYQSSRLAQNAGATPLKAEGYWTFDAMAAYQINAHVAVQLNVYNIADRYYFGQLHPWHVVPGAGRSALLAVKFNN
jgi:catecholate siderophore receptor